VSSSTRNEDYKLLVVLTTYLNTHTRCLAVKELETPRVMNLNPPAKGFVLKRWNGSLLARIFALATISLDSPKKITQEWKRGSERALLLLAGLFCFENEQERGK
jgi:hypothetical protein